MSEARDRLLSLTTLRYKTLPIFMEQMKISADEKYTDNVSLILRCHLVTEAVLDKLIILCLIPNGKAVLSANLRYTQKLDIVSRSFITEDFELLPNYVVSSLRQLNKLRNRLSQNLNASVTQQEALDLFQGIEHPMPFDIKKDNVSKIIYHYTSFIFGHMLPNYEATE